MFTQKQIDDIHEKFGKPNAILDYLKALKAIGVSYYDSFISDGHSEYFGKENQKLISPAVHKTLTISGTSHREKFLEHLSAHNEGKTTYLEMSEGLAKSGVEKWRFDTAKSTISYYAKDGTEMLVEDLT